jgi:hypothetical protein
MAHFERWDFSYLHKSFKTIPPLLFEPGPPSLFYLLLTFFFTIFLFVYQSKQSAALHSLLLFLSRELQAKQRLHSLSVSLFVSSFICSLVRLLLFEIFSLALQSVGDFVGPIKSYGLSRNVCRICLEYLLTSAPLTSAI